MRYLLLALFSWWFCAAFAFAQDDPRAFDFKWGHGYKEPPYAETPGTFQKALEDEMADVDAIVFAVRANGKDGHWYANFGYVIGNPGQYKYGGMGGKLCVLNPHTGEIRTLINDRTGDVRDPAVHYDGKTILFSWRKGGTHTYHLYTIQSDGSGLTQLTDGEFDDMEPVWLPDGGIMFCSARCRRWVPCWYVQVAIMFRCDADGSNIRPISFGVENENTPWPLPDGRVLYTRWEYVDRKQLHYHGLWTINPDGTDVQLLYDNQGTMNLYIDAKPIPDTGKIVTIISPMHGRTEHAGRIGILDPQRGPESAEDMRFLDRGYPTKYADTKRGTKGAWRDPYPVSERCFLAAAEHGLAVIDAEGNHEFFYELSEEEQKRDLKIHEPRVIRSRERERLIPHITPAEDGMATFNIMDVHIGRNMKGIEHGQIKSLVIMEELPRPAANAMDPDIISNTRGNYILHRILGKVPVEEDGSAHFKVPAGRAIFFYALDKDGLSAKTMPSYLAAMSGEQVGCIGCHEDKLLAPPVKKQSPITMALERAPSRIEPVEGVPEIIDYMRDIQPVWDKHCVSCHNFEKFAGQLILEADLTPAYNVSYNQIKLPRFGKDYELAICYPGYEPDPYSTASGGSRLVKTLMQGHHKVELNDVEMERIIRWIDAGATFAGTYAALGWVNKNQRIALEDRRDKAFTEQCKPVKDVLARRCDGCHQKKGPAGKWITEETRRVGHRFNVSRPDKSFFLLAPLAKPSGGLEICRAKDGREVPVFADTNDPDYQVLQEYARMIAEQFDAPRWFQEGHRPEDWYIREMKRYGALPEDFDIEKNAFDGYATDEAYFRMIYRMGPGPKTF
ncbi:MAG: hypothetical protein ACLFQ6_00730 [Candidatus Sumerlaeia bacterium]